MKGVPWWAWTAGAIGLGAVVAGGFVSGYAQDVLLQVGTVALLLVPIVVAERAIQRSLRRQARDQAAIREVETAMSMDDMWKDFGQKVTRRTEAQPLHLVEDELLASGWHLAGVHDGHRFWTNGDVRVALPEVGRPLHPAVVRMVVRRAGWRDAHLERWSTPH